MEEYLKTLLEQVRCKEAHPYIESEIRGHIEDQIETNLMDGMSEADAVTEAIRDMGSPVESGIALDKIHRPALCWDMLLLVGLISILGSMVHLFIGGNAPGSSNFAFYTLIGFASMLIIYRLDYSFLASYAKLIAGGMICIELLTIIAGEVVNGVSFYFSLGTFHFSIFAFMMLYVPIYGAVLYQYYGTGYRGLAKGILWMLIPCLLALRIPSISLSMILFSSMAIVLSLAVYKGWFQISKKRFAISFWSFVILAPILFLFSAFIFQWLEDYQMARLRALLSASGESFFLPRLIRSYLLESQFIGTAGTNITEQLPDYNSSYILTYLTSSYGILAGILVCMILTLLIFKIFRISLKQRNQLGMLMGCGCGVVIFINSALNIAQNLGLAPLCQSFLPFFSSGGSCIIISYIMMGIILSIYRYKNIFPIHFRKGSRIKLSIKFEKKNAM